MKNKITFFLILALLYSCNSSSTNEKETEKKSFQYSITEKKYRYSNELIRYLNDIFELKAIPNGYMFFIPLNSCSPCVEKTLDELQGLEHNEAIKKIILIGIPNDSLIIQKTELLYDRFKSKILHDKQSNLFRYELNIGGPNIIIFDKNIAEFQIELSENSWINKKQELSFLLH